MFLVRKAEERLFLSRKRASRCRSENVLICICLAVVEHSADDGNATVLQRGDEGLQGGSRRHVLAGDNDSTAGAGGDGLAVGGFGAGRGIDDHDIVLAGSGGHQRIEDRAG